MIYVLDTDILSLLAHRDSPEAPRIRRRIAELPMEDAVVTTIINYEEQIRGWMAVLSRARTSKAEVEAYDRLLQHLLTFRQVAVLPYNDAAAAVLQRLRKLRIGRMDLRIASIVLAHDAVLVTRNVVDFGKVGGLRVENWTIEAETDAS
ncbi:MAG TPA: type II toxin-antitoxin system VapC family toxin [Tepidisphaeraceae bacterium]|jgi:tRNA(fMet)-specific endonuclease VapC